MERKTEQEIQEKYRVFCRRRWTNGVPDAVALVRWAAEPLLERIAELEAAQPKPGRVLTDEEIKNQLHKYSMPDVVRASAEQDAIDLARWAIAESGDAELKARIAELEAQYDPRPVLVEKAKAFRWYSAWHDTGHIIWRFGGGGPVSFGDGFVVRSRKTDTDNWGRYQIDAEEAVDILTARGQDPLVQLGKEE